MADQDPRETLKVALRDLDTNALHTLMVAAYDRWCWDSGSDMDKDWYEVSEELLKERGIVSSSSTFTLQGQSPGAPMMTLQQAPQDITIKANKFKVQPPNNTLDYDVVDMSQGNFQIGFDLKQALVEFLSREIDSGTMSGATGMNLKNQLEMLITGQISMAEWAIRPMIDRAIEEHERKKESAG